MDAVVDCTAAASHQPAAGGMLGRRASWAAMLVASAHALGTMPPAPPGYTFLASSVIGDSVTQETCHTANTGNIDPPDQLTAIEPIPCVGESCISAAFTTCDAHPDCQAYAIDALGGDPAKAVRAQLFRAGLGNAIPEPTNVWHVYAKAKPCDTCPGGDYGPAAMLPNSKAAWIERHVCKAPGNGYPCGHCSVGGVMPCAGGGGSRT